LFRVFCVLKKKKKTREPALWNSTSFWMIFLYSEIRTAGLDQSNRQPESKACPWKRSAQRLNLWAEQYYQSNCPRNMHFLSLFWLAGYLGLGRIIFSFLQFKTNRQPGPAKMAGVTSATRTFFSWPNPRNVLFFSTTRAVATPWVQDIWWLVRATSSYDLHPVGNISLSIKICSKLNNI